MRSSSSVLLCGATGLVGWECLRLLMHDSAFERVTALARRPLPEDLRDLGEFGKLREHVVDFDALHAGVLPRVDQVICALGTTLRKAGSRERFREIDLGYPLRIAGLAQATGAKHFLLVSALGANATSRIFYNRIKGELEEALLALGYRSTTVVRPSLLLGERKELRLGEEIARRFAFLAPSRYRPVTAEAVAAALLAAARDDEPGVRVVESAEIIAEAERYAAMNPPSG